MTSLKLTFLRGFRMLAEFLLTPDALSGGDGPETVRKLAQCLFPRHAASPALICMLGGEKWVQAASQKIARLSNPNQRFEAMSLFQKLHSQICVNRPPLNLASDDETDWIRAGVASASHVPVDRIVVSSKATPPAQIGVTIEDFISDAFWEHFENPRLVGRDTTTQEQVLRAICTHSDWLMVRLPQIRGGSDDEIVTVKQIIRLSNQVPEGFGKTAIDVHICMQPRITEQALFRSVSAELSPFIAEGIQVQITVWPERHFVNRELLAGDFTKTSPGNIIRRPRWWITMTHVAVGSRNAANAGEGANTWSLFSRKRAYERFEQIIGDNQSKPLTDAVE
jgi:hypothetical protein